MLGLVHAKHIAGHSTAVGLTALRTLKRAHEVRQGSPVQTCRRQVTGRLPSNERVRRHIELSLITSVLAFMKAYEALKLIARYQRSRTLAVQAPAHSG
ncbi:hypothetical protein VARIO8X_70061 [Burkholderiales bacterium 8X]|nr:hypothetical protein VARIO8X_70061 [Burkholderiales bacterium 8X]